MKKNFALPAVNVVGTNSVNAVLETAREINSPVMIQFSNGGAHFFAGKGLSNADQQGSVLGAILRRHARPCDGQGLWRNCHPAYRPLRQETAALGRRDARSRGALF